jgi:hypothetical protein
MISWLKHLLVPHRGNNHRPHVLRTPIIRAFLAVVIMGEALFLLRAFNLLPEMRNFAAVLSSAMVVETNIDRKSENLPELTVNPLLEEAARQKAKDMAEKGYFSHIGPGGEEPWKWMKGVGYYYLSAGENLAINFTDSKDVTDAWMNSPAHRSNMLSGNFTEIGIGTAEGIYKGKETTFVVQFFGKPYIAPAPIAKEIPQVKKTPTPVPVKKPAVVAELAVPSSTPTTSDDVRQPPPPPLPLSTDVAVAPSTSSVEVLGTDTKVLEGNIVREKPTMLGFMMTNPRQTTMFAALFFAVLVAIGLVLTLIFRKKTQHRDLITNGLAFLALILCMIVVNDYFSTKDILLS